LCVPREVKLNGLNPLSHTLGFASVKFTVLYFLESLAITRTAIIVFFADD